MRVRAGELGRNDRSGELRGHKRGARSGSGSGGSGPSLAAFSLALSLLQSVFINYQLKLAERSLVCKLSFEEISHCVFLNTKRDFVKGTARTVWI